MFSRKDVYPHPLAPVYVTFLGDRVFAEVIMLRQ